jgi:hypothetical protein
MLKIGTVMIEVLLAHLLKHARRTASRHPAIGTRSAGIRADQREVSSLTCSSISGADYFKPCCSLCTLAASLA